MATAFTEHALNYFVGKMNSMRDLTSIELFTNQEFYAFHRYIKKNVHLFKCENTAFSASASDAALGNGYDRKDPSSRVVVVQQEAVKNLTSGTYASLICFVFCYWDGCYFSLPRRAGSQNQVLQVSKWNYFTKESA